jgi:phosphoribosylformylglycinamidine synthase
MELAKTNLIVGMQDMGAAGITCSTSEMSAKGKCGMNVWLDKVPTRQEGMKPYEILLSESQERMLVVIKKGHENEVRKIFDKWDLNCEQIGEVIEGDILNFYFNNELVAQVPAESLVLGGGAPVYKREYKEPAYIAETKKFKIDSVKQPKDLKKVAYTLLGYPNIASKRWIYEQYDSMVGTVNMSTNAPSDAGLVNLKNSKKALAMSVDCNSRYVYAHPEIGAQIAVAECARNISCTGAIPSAITNCLNFGNPYNPESYWQFVHAIKGMGAACQKFHTPVTGGNVSFYNQSVIDGKEIPVFPTPTIGMIGILNDKNKRMSLHFKEKGDLIFVIGKTVEDINSSEYLYYYHGVKLSPPPYFNLDEEYKLHQTTRTLIDQQLINAAHDCADGGIWVSLVEMCMPNKLGFDMETDSEIRTDAFLFGESQGRVLVGVNQSMEEDFIEFMTDSGTPFTLLGHVTKGKFQVDGEPFGNVDEAREIFDHALGKLIES